MRNFTMRLWFVLGVPPVRPCPFRPLFSKDRDPKAFPLIALLWLVSFAAPMANAADYQRGAMMRVAPLYISPDPISSKLSDIERGREVIILETSREWLHVEANVTEERTVTGWMVGKGAVRASTPDGDRVLYGEGVDSEEQASKRRGGRGTAEEGLRHSHRVGSTYAKYK